MRVGVISDTHGKLRPEAIAALHNCALILHAGDIGRAQVLEELRKAAPRVVAVRGNVDGDWAAGLPEQAEVDVAGHRVLLLHDLSRLAVDPRACGFDAVVSGHSHQPRIERRQGVLYVNPGSAGPRRFRLPVALARLHVSATRLDAEIVQLPV
ncbi:MAG TPA: metallophosphoesterase family protein [Steroidobacteraceae bacterium]|nr:metallophosphoesterase family protein [Steroidobacteraceae bacterium]